MIRTLLLDADGVVQRINPAALRAIEDMTPSCDKRGFVAAIMEAERPCLSKSGDFCLAIADVLGAWKCRASPHQVSRLWNDIIADPDVLDLVSAARRSGIRCCLASNQQALRSSYMSTVLGYSQLFDREFYSHELGVAKPEAAYFATILGALAEPASTVLFFDDNSHNVEAAASVGIHAEYFPAHSGAATVKRLLDKYGVSVA